MTSDSRGFPAVQVTQYDYVERTTALAVTPTTDATAETWIAGNPVAYSGTQRVRVEAWSWDVNCTSGQQLVINLYDGAVDLGRIGILGNSASATLTIPLYVSRFLTPSNGVHTYNIKVWKTGGTANLDSGAGGTATAVPSWMRITPA